MDRPAKRPAQLPGQMSKALASGFGKRSRRPGLISCGFAIRCRRWRSSWRSLRTYSCARLAAKWPWTVAGLGSFTGTCWPTGAVELAKTEVFGSTLPDFVESARYVVQASIPVGLNDEGLKREEAVHKMEICFDLLSSYFEEGAELTQVNLIYELFTTQDLMRRAELLLTEDLGEMALSKAWTDLMAEERDLTLLAYTALQVEARRPGTVPQELLASLSTKVSGESLSTKCIGHLEGDAVEYIEEVEELLRQDSDLGKLVAYEHVSQLIDSERVNSERLAETARAIQEDIRKFEELLALRNEQKGGKAA